MVAEEGTADLFLLAQAQEGCGRKQSICKHTYLSSLPLLLFPRILCQRQKIFCQTQFTYAMIGQNSYTFLSSLPCNLAQAPEMTTTFFFSV